jgi:hypothetical protein
MAGTADSEIFNQAMQHAGEEDEELRMDKDNGRLSEEQQGAAPQRDD